MIVIRWGTRNMRHRRHSARRDRVLGALVTSLLAGLGTTGAASAGVPDPGDLDRHFAGTGKTTLDIRHSDSAQGIAIDAQGRIVVAGSTSDATSGDFTVARYMPDGSLDPSFGTDGIVRTDFSGRADRATVLATAALALNQVDRVIEAVRRSEDVGTSAEPPPTVDTTLEFDVSAGAIVARRWSRHPRCWC